MDNIVKVTGLVEILLYNKGILKHHIITKNMVVTAGKALIASRLVDAVDTAPSHMWVGTSNTAESVGQTNLLLPVADGRIGLSGTSRTSNIITYTATFDAGIGTGLLVEAGIFNANTGGTMLCRTVFASVPKNADDILTINWNLTIN